MNLNVDKLNELFETKAEGNYNEFARQTKIDVGLLYRILNRKSNAGLKTINQIIEYCKLNGIDFTGIIF